MNVFLNLKAVNRLFVENRRFLTLVCLFVILLFGGFLRTFGLDISPPSLNWDEASIGYNSYSLMKTGRDEYGQFMPLFIRSFDDYKSAIPSYLAIPLIATLGLNDISIRLVSVIAGLLSILFIYLISKKLIYSDSVSLLAAFIMAISPFAVHFSRVLFEANIALSFFLLGYLFYLYSDKKLYLFLAIFFFILSLYTYHSYKLLVPLFLLSTFIFSFKNIRMDKTFFTLSLFILILLLPQIFEIINGSALARFSTTSIFSLWPPPIVNELNQNHPDSLYFLHNKYFYFFWELGGRYLAYFSPSNIFLLEAVEPNLRIPYLAILYPFTFIFWISGMFFTLKNFKKYKTLVILILLSPVPAILTWNWFQSVRVLTLFAVFTILIGIGVSYIGNFIVENMKIFNISRNVKVLGFYLIVIILGIWNSFYLLDCLNVIIPSKYFGDWQPGFKDSIPTVASLQDKYDQIIIDSPQAQPYIFTLFYAAYPPEKYLNEVDYEKISKKPRDFYDFGKFKFRKIYWPDDRNSKKNLFMGTVFSLPEQDIKTTPNAKLIKDVLDNDKNVSVRIVGTQ